MKTEATNIQLIDAVNLLCQHVEGRLKNGYQIVLEMSSDECTLELHSPDGDCVEFESDRTISLINLAIAAAEEHAAEQKEEQKDLPIKDFVVVPATRIEYEDGTVIQTDEIHIQGKIVEENDDEDSAAAEDSAPENITDEE